MVHFDRVRAKAWQLLINVFDEAMSDGCIDFDEGRIISSTNLNVNNLLDYITGAWEDNNLDHTERANIEFLVRKIEDDAISLAHYDDIITKQEAALLDIIRNLVEHFAHEENCIIH